MFMNAKKSMCLILISLLLFNLKRDMTEINIELARSAEDKIRIRAATKGIRVNEFFHDYDRLRSGYVTSILINFF
jgi:hypothetical protein